VGHDLVTIKIEVDPFRRTATLCATKQIAVKVAGGCQVINRKRQVEGA
jgi:hypothetical protein